MVYLYINYLKMSWPKQYVSVWGVRIPTEEFVKDREAIMKRLANEETKTEKGQMMNISQRKFEETLNEVKKDLEEEKVEETPVATVSKTEDSVTETPEPIQAKVETKKVTTSKKTSWRGKKK